MKTLPEQIQELESKVSAHASELATLKTENAALIIERDGLATQNKAMIAERDSARSEVETLKGQFSTVNAENTKLKGEMKSAEELAVAIMAKVGQPNPVSADTTGGDKPGSVPAPKQELTGLERTMSFFRSKKS